MTSMTVPVNIIAVYFLNLLVQTPWTKTIVIKMTKIAAKAALTGIFGRYPQYDRTNGQVSKVQAARHAFRSSNVPFKHRNCSNSCAIDSSMIARLLMASFGECCRPPIPLEGRELSIALECG